MPIPTPFHTRTAPLCESWEWRNWAGYLAPSLYEPTHAREYFAIRNSAALIDVSPLYKYSITGPDALRLVDRIVTRDVTRCAVGQVMYAPWCDAAGKLLDDGVVARLGPREFRITAAHPNLRWFQDAGEGLDAAVRDVSQELAALALQGPHSRAILKQLFTDVDWDRLGYFRLAQGALDGRPVSVTRTGYTGDLGYELWVAPALAESLWDRIMAAGADYGLLPVGMAALDVARIEAGLPLVEVDYISAYDALLEGQKSSPFELGLGWAVALDGGEFIGKAALQAEKARGARWAFVGLQVDWFELERLYNAVGLRPQAAGKRASRSPVPVYSNGRQIGQAASHVFSPLLKRYLALATVEAAYAQPGAALEMEITVEYRRELARATVAPLPFFNPPRKRA
jgi:aminomethyltransferase